MIGVYAPFEIKAEHKTEFEQLVKQIIAVSRQHKGCISYDCGELHDKPNHFAFIEQWKSLADQQAHFQQADLQQLASRLPEFLEGELIIHFIELLGEQSE